MSTKPLPSDRATWLKHVTSEGLSDMTIAAVIEGERPFSGSRLPKRAFLSFRAVWHDGVGYGKGRSCLEEASIIDPRVFDTARVLLGTKDKDPRWAGFVSLHNFCKRIADPSFDKKPETPSRQVGSASATYRGKIYESFATAIARFESLESSPYHDLGDEPSSPSMSETGPLYLEMSPVSSRLLERVSDESGVPPARMTPKTSPIPEEDELFRYMDELGLDSPTMNIQAIRGRDQSTSAGTSRDAPVSTPRTSSALSQTTPSAPEARDQLEATHGRSEFATNTRTSYEVQTSAFFFNFLGAFDPQLGLRSLPIRLDAEEYRYRFSCRTAPPSRKATGFAAAPDGSLYYREKDTRFLVALVELKPFSRSEEHQSSIAYEETSQMVAALSELANRSILTNNAPGWVILLILPTWHPMIDLIS